MAAKKQSVRDLTAALKKASETWLTFNEAMRNAGEAAAALALALERDGACRKQYLLRAHARMNRMRAIREREKLIEAAEEARG